MLNIIGYCALAFLFIGCSIRVYKDYEGITGTKRFIFVTLGLFVIFGLLLELLKWIAITTFAERAQDNTERNLCTTS